MNHTQGSGSLTTGQTTALKALVDGLIPSLPPPAGADPNDATITKYWNFRLADDDEFIKILVASILENFPPARRVQMLGMLSLLSTVTGTICMFGMVKASAFANWSTAEKTEGLAALKSSKLLYKRTAFQCAKRWIASHAFTYLQAGTRKNPFWAAIGYPGPPECWKEKCSTDPSLHKRPLVSGNDIIPESCDSTGTDQKLVCDIVIVGSGAGGSTAAYNLAAAGYSVIILDKGSYLPPNEMTQLEMDSVNKMYDGKGFVSSADANFVVFAGSNVGGGPSINWSCCLPTPDYVRKEWVEEHDLPQFSPNGDYEKALREVFERMGVTTDPHLIHHNEMNKKLQAGCDALGFEWSATGQNVKTTEKTAGYVCFGDRYGIKRDMAAVYLQSAVENGARILDRCRVSEILRSWDPQAKRSRAAGVICQRAGSKIIVEAKRSVILAAGSIHTPIILQASRFKNAHIGKHLRIHPVAGVYGFFPDTIDCCLGAPMTTVCSEFARGPNDNWYGARIECPSTHPGQTGLALPWRSPVHFKQTMLNYRRMLPAIVLQRDTTEGSVYMGLGGFPVINYVMNETDKESLVAGLKGALQIMVAAGAEECVTSHEEGLGFKAVPGSKPSKEDMKSDQALQHTLAVISKRSFRECDMCMLSAHQMGTCRMSRCSSSGVVDCNGETWECNDVYVMDASVFPTASGANPMMTVLAISQMLSSRLAIRLEFEDGKLKDSEKIDRAEETLLFRARSRPPDTLLRVLTNRMRSDLSNSTLHFLLGASVPVASLVWIWCRIGRRY